MLLLTDGNEDGSSTLTLIEAVAHATDDGVLMDAVYIVGDASAPASFDTGPPTGVSSGGRTAASLGVRPRGSSRGPARNQVLITADLPARVTASPAEVEVKAMRRHRLTALTATRDQQLRR